ncbi:MAG TPA: hypothetical protein VH165_22010 [Kofleriaceae bacterium]|jgi:hypothetical protein|nr:hypothetical protein [Kofleriaceae bacterium]
MWRWILLAVVIAAALGATLFGGGHDMSDREYCTRRQMAWEMAFPNLPQTDDDRSAFVESCITNIAPAHDNGELARSIRCMNEHLVGHGHAYDQYVAFTTCEQVDPTRER